MEKWSWYWNYNPLGPLYFWETKHFAKKKKKILIGIFEFFIISFLLLEKKGFNGCINKYTVMCIIEYTLSTQRSTDSLKGIFDDNLFFYYFAVKGFFCCLEMVFSEKTNKNSCQSLLEISEPFHRTNYICYFFCWRKYVLNVFLNLVSSSLLLGEVIVRQCFAFLF